MAEDSPKPPGELACRVSDFADDDRVKVTVNNREVVIFQRKDKYHALDAKCFHQGGPLHAGDIEDIEGRPCVKCPSHRYRICIENGERFMEMHGFNMSYNKDCMDMVEEEVIDLTVTSEEESSDEDIMSESEWRPSGPEDSEEEEEEEVTEEVEFLGVLAPQCTETYQHVKLVMELLNSMEGIKGDGIRNHQRGSQRAFVKERTRYTSREITYM